MTWYEVRLMFHDARPLSLVGMDRRSRALRYAEESIRTNPDVSAAEVRRVSTTGYARRMGALYEVETVKRFHRTPSMSLGRS